MNKCLKGYISVLLIIFISFITLSIIFISLNFNQSVKIAKNSQIKAQSKYISQAYLQLLLTKLDKSYILEEKEGKFTENLFFEIEHSTNYKIFKEAMYEGELANKVFVYTSYKNIKSSAEAQISKFNRLFFLNMGTLTRVKLGEQFSKYFAKIEKYIEKDEIFNNTYTNINFTSGERLVNIHSNNLSTILNNKITQYINNTGNFYIDNYLEVGDEKYNNKVALFGNIYLTGTIKLNTDVDFQGNIISNGGKIETNGHSFNIDGVVLEVGEGGSLAGVNLRYNLHTNYLKALELAKMREVICIKLNNE